MVLPSPCVRCQTGIGIGDVANAEVVTERTSSEAADRRPPGALGAPAGGASWGSPHDVAVLASTSSRDSGACGGGGVFRDGRRGSLITAAAHWCPFCDNAPGVWRRAPGLPVFGTDGFGSLYRSFLWRTIGRQCRAGTGGGELR